MRFCLGSNSRIHHNRTPGVCGEYTKHQGLGLLCSGSCPSRSFDGSQCIHACILLRNSLNRMPNHSDGCRRTREDGLVGNERPLDLQSSLDKHPVGMDHNDSNPRQGLLSSCSLLVHRHHRLRTCLHMRDPKVVHEAVSSDVLSSIAQQPMGHSVIRIPPFDSCTGYHHSTSQTPNLPLLPCSDWHVLD